jgi:hypothetical protein
MIHKYKNKWMNDWLINWLDEWKDEIMWINGRMYEWIRYHCCCFYINASTCIILFIGYI